MFQKKQQRQEQNKNKEILLYQISWLQLICLYEANNRQKDRLHKQPKTKLCP